MKIIFSIEYHTDWGQRLFLYGSSDYLGNWDENLAIPLEYTKDGIWTAEIDVDTSDDEPFEYRYFLLDENVYQTIHESASRTFEFPAKKVEKVSIIDWWRALENPENALYTSAFSKVLLKNNTSVATQLEDNPSAYESRKLLSFTLRTPRVADGFAVCISGNHEKLGDWGKKNTVTMDGQQHPTWKATFGFNELPYELQYKFGIKNLKTGELVALESGPNRIASFPKSNGSDELTILNCENLQLDEQPWKGAGVAIPVFSLRSQNGHGVGEFLDLKLLIDWANKVGLKLIQVLPINDTIATHTWVDSYPYSAVSVFALHPIYLNLEAIGKLSDKKAQLEFEKQRSILNQSPTVDYEAVMQIKSRFYKLIFDETADEFLADEQFKSFYSENRDWLAPYAAFSCLRDRFKTSDFNQWQEFSNPTQKQIEDFTNPKAAHYPDVAVHYFIQFHLYKQMREVAAYAREKGVVLKGDIPIGIFRHSVDSWIDRKCFNLGSQAGAPPDDFSVEGQNWGFPTYNWQEMSKDEYSWWQKRLQNLSRYFDSFRIDHILGFFRIWEIPLDQIQGTLGRFNPRLSLGKREIIDRGIPFDEMRMCKPYIRRYHIEELFDDRSNELMEIFFAASDDDFLFFKPEFSNQKAIENWYSEQELTSRDAREYVQEKKKLQELLGEVLFLIDEVDGEKRYNPRVSFRLTRSFRELNEDVQAKLMDLYNDYFYRRHVDFWKERALVKLPVIKDATDMLICGEDLGMVPASVPGVMAQLGIVSLEIQRMPKRENEEFGIPDNYIYLSVCSPSCHDMSTIRGWWEEDREKTQRFFNKVLNQSGQAPYFCDTWVVEAIINQHLHSPSMWAIFPIQDLVAIDEELRLEDATAERINDPSNPKHYWKYRFHLDLEEMIANTALNSRLKTMISESGRLLDF